jgi:L-fuculose-phosphate aldolase
MANESGQNLQPFKEKLVAVGKALRDEGLILGGEGNLSLRLPSGNILVTPARVCKGRLNTRMLLILDPKGNVVEGTLMPSSELLLHLHVYRTRKDVGGIVHAHPPYATGFACAGMSLDMPILAEMIVMLKGVPLVPYANPGSIELVEAISPYLEDRDAFLLANHGVVAVGPDLETALQRMELVEQFAKVALITYQLGRQNPIPGKNIRDLESLHEKYRILPYPQENLPYPKVPRIQLAELMEELIRRYLKKV